MDAARFVLEEGDPVHHRHHQIQDAHVDSRAGLEDVERAMPVDGLDDVVALGFEEHSQRVAEVRVVVHDQDVRRAGHASVYLGTGPSARLLWGIRALRATLRSKPRGVERCSTAKRYRTLHARFDELSPSRMVTLPSS